MVSIKDVASLAGVSTATVSRALSQPDKVSQTTRDKVMAAVEQSGYQPNTAARQFRTQKTETVLVLVPDIGNPFFSNIIQGIESEALAAGYRVVLGETNPDLSAAGTYAGYMQQQHADGVILLGAEGAERFVDTPGGKPVVMACEYLADSSLPHVRIDNVTAAADAVSYLIELGHKRIAYIDGPVHNPISQDRLEGYQLALQRAGIEVDKSLLSRGDFSPASGHQAALSLLGSDNPPTAIFAISDPMAIGAMRAASEMGINIPGDLSLMGFDDIRFAGFMTPALTTINQPRRQLGATAMKMLLARLSDESTPLEMVLEHRLVVRESTARL